MGMQTECGVACSVHMHEHACSVLGLQVGGVYEHAGGVHMRMQVGGVYEHAGGVHMSMQVPFMKMIGFTGRGAHPPPPASLGGAYTLW